MNSRDGVGVVALGFLGFNAEVEFQDVLAICPRDIFKKSLQLSKVAQLDRLEEGQGRPWCWKHCTDLEGSGNTKLVRPHIDPGEGLCVMHIEVVDHCQLHFVG